MKNNNFYFKSSNLKLGDPATKSGIAGYVQVPCIERNAVAAIRAIDAAEYTSYTDGAHKVSFDEIVQTMVETGKDMNTKYKETSLGGLAKRYL